MSDRSISDTCAASRYSKKGGKSCETEVIFLLRILMLNFQFLTKNAQPCGKSA